MTKRFEKILVIGGAGYVGSVLVPKLLKEGYKVRVFDILYFGNNLPAHDNLEVIKGDVRDITAVADAIKGCDALIHLACISNDPSFELDPSLGKSINYDCFKPLVLKAKNIGVKRFIYASSSSVYGVKNEERVTEDLTLEPLTDYSKFKAMCELELLAERTESFETVIIRPATVCGYSPRLRLDLAVNILTNFARNEGYIKVFGGEQQRPNIHIDDMARVYLSALTWSSESLEKEQIFNAGYHNHSLKEIAEIVRDNTSKTVDLRFEATNDNRSYRVCSEKIKRIHNFEPKFGIEKAVKDLVAAFDSGKIPNSMSDPRYSNIKTMQKILG